MVALPKLSQIVHHNNRNESYIREGGAAVRLRESNSPVRHPHKVQKKTWKDYDYDSSIPFLQKVMLPTDTCIHVARTIVLRTFTGFKLQAAAQNSLLTDDSSSEEQSSAEMSTASTSQRR